MYVLLDILVGHVITLEKLMHAEMASDHAAVINFFASALVHVRIRVIHVRV